MFQTLEGMRILSCIKLDAVKSEYISFRVELLICGTAFQTQFHEFAIF